VEEFSNNKRGKKAYKFREIPREVGGMNESNIIPSDHTEVPGNHMTLYPNYRNLNPELKVNPM
jgi:hypothetical protein